MTKMWKSKGEHIIFDGKCTTYMLTNLLHTLFLLPLCKLTLSLSFLQTRQGNLDGIHLVDKPTFLKCKNIIAYFQVEFTI